MPTPDQLLDKALKAKTPRIAMWDIETTDLKADWGEMLSYGIKPLYGEPWVRSVMDWPRRFERDPLDDKALVRQCVKDLSQFDAVVTWYGRRFDRRFLNARCAFHKIDPPPQGMAHVDAWFTARYELALSSNRLAVVQEFLGLDDEKTPIKRRVWKKAKRGDKKALRYVINHNLMDVIVLEQAYLRLLPYIRSHPNVGLLQGEKHACPKCGAGQEYIERAGWHYATTRAYPRVRCRKCKSWSRYRSSEPGDVTDYR